MKKINATAFSATSLLLILSLSSLPHALASGEPSCEDTSLNQGDYCLDGSNQLSIVTKVKSRENKIFNRGKTVIKHRHLRKSELQAYLGGNNNSGYGDHAQDDFDTLNSFCSALPEKISEREATNEDLNEQIKAIDLNTLQKAEKDAYAKMLTGCRRDCLTLSIMKDATCAISPEKLSEVVTKDDLNDKLLHLSNYYGGQSELLSVIESHQEVDSKKACSKMLMNAECKAEIVKSGLSDCEEGAAWVVALTALEDGKKTVAELKAKQDIIAKNSSEKSCTVTSAWDVKKPLWNTCNTRCLEKALDSCATALANAEMNLQSSGRDPYCADCGVRGGGSQDGRNGYGNFASGNGNNNGFNMNGANTMNGNGVSKAAQIISALGGPVSSIAGGLMNMSMYNKGIAACTSMYSQQIELSQTVGLPASNPNCSGMVGMNSGSSGMYGNSMYGNSMYGANMGSMYGSTYGSSMPASYNPYASSGSMYGTNMYGNSSSMPMSYSPYGNSNSTYGYGNYGNYGNMYGNGYGNYGSGLNFSAGLSFGSY